MVLLKNIVFETWKVSLIYRYATDGFMFPKLSVRHIYFASFLFVIINPILLLLLFCPSGAFLGDGLSDYKRIITGLSFATLDRVPFALIWTHVVFCWGTY